MIATVKRVPVDLIIHTLAERFKEADAKEGHDVLALGLYACIDSNSLAEEWATSSGVAQSAMWIGDRITESWVNPPDALARVAEVAVAKRLLATAANLCVTQDAEDHAAATALMQAAQRILGVAMGKPATGFTVPTYAEVQADMANRLLSLQAAIKERGAAYANNQRLLEMRNTAVKENDKWRSWAGETVGRPDWNGHDQELRALVMDRFASIKVERDAAIETVRKTRAVLDAALGTTKGATTFTLEGIALELVFQRNAVIRERDAAIKDIAGKVAAADARALGAHQKMEHADMVLGHVRKERDAHAATIETLRRTIETLRRTIEESKSLLGVKARPQPGDSVPWTEVEDGCLYYVKDTSRFRVALHGTTGVMSGLEDPDIEAMLQGRYVGTKGTDLGPDYPSGVLIARDLGVDPEAWRAAMREWTANGNRPKVTRLLRVGDTVRVARKVIIDSRGRNCDWDAEMDSIVGSTITVLVVDHERNHDPITVYAGNEATETQWWYSPEALDLITPAPA